MLINLNLIELNILKKDVKISSLTPWLFGVQICFEFPFDFMELENILIFRIIFKWILTLKRREEA